MKKLGILTLAMALTLSAQAVFAHGAEHYGFDYVPQDKGGYTGTSDTKITTVLEAKKLGSNAYVKLKGKIASKTGKETYLFKDNTGTITVEIDDDNWKGIKAGPKDTVIIEGELEREFSGVIVDVDKIQLAN